MEQLMLEVTQFAARQGIKPGTVLQQAAKLSGKTWGEWLSGASCSLKTAEKIRRFISDNSNEASTEAAE